MSEPRNRNRIRIKTATRLGGGLPTEVPPEQGEPLEEALAREELQAQLAEPAGTPPSKPFMEALQPESKRGKRIQLVTAMSAGSGWAARWRSRSG